jgi:co-chaperonin GroES (HSP10)
VDEDEPWSATGDDNDMRYISLQAQIGDYAVFLRKSAIDVEFDNEEYVVVSHAAILLLVRDDEIVP